MPKYTEHEKPDRRRHRPSTPISPSPERFTREGRERRGRWERDRQDDDDESSYRHGSTRHDRNPKESDHRQRRRDDHHSSKRKRASTHDSTHDSKSERSPSPSRHKRSKVPLPSQEQSYKGTENQSQTLDKPSDVEKQKPNFNTTGKLAAETNTVAGIVLKYNEPPEARKPASRDAWRLYVFKGPELLESVELFERSCWLLGRERAVADFPVDHPSCSKQHAVFQFRHVVKTNEFGDKNGRVRPYIIDLESANGTMVNGEKIPPTRYVELRHKDMIQFGLSTREYVLMLPP